ncbi:APUM3 [Symbiodinium natans]|uniref:APUM3 protein n=1 Tax=Symbiodinium natans TaxID=878477 RepID=A0A812TLY3_9DINO|nr:APUM3 [Symbiodinium natans]
MVCASKMPSPSRCLSTLLLALLGPAVASPQDKPPAAAQSVEKQKPRSISHGLTAVGLPMPWGAAAPTSSVVQGQLAPAIHATGQATSSLWACIVAGAGAVGHNIRQQNREPRRPRHGRRGPSRQTTAASATSTTVVEVEQQVESEAEVAGWQTASEDEDDRSQQIGQQHRMQFLQQVMRHEMQQQQGQPFADQQGMAFFNQQQQQQQPFRQQNFQQPQLQPFYDGRPFNQQQVVYWPNQMPQHAVNPQFNQQMQMQMQQAMSQQPQLQAFAPMPQMQQMVLVAVPVVPENSPVSQGDEAPAHQPDMEHLRNFSMGHRAPSVSSTPSEISMEMGSSVSTQTPSNRERATSRWNGKESEAVVRQLRAPGLDAASRKRLLERIVQDAWSMAITKHGTRVVQAAFEVAAEISEKQNLLDVLRGKVWQALKSPHANHVLQKAIAHMPPQKLDFIISELRGRVGDAARHPFGCRVLERLLEHGLPEQLEPISREVLSDILELCRHPYGNYVVQHSLAHGSPEQRTRLCEAMRPEMGRLARHKVASHVVECALLHSSPEEREQLKNSMAGNAEELASLTASNYGSFVVKEMKKR